MKKILLLLSIIALTSCSKEDIASEDCNCQRDIYERTSTIIYTNGSPHLTFDFEYLYSESVECQEPVNDWQDLGNDNLVYKITCD